MNAAQTSSSATTDCPVCGGGGWEYLPGGRVRKCVCRQQSVEVRMQSVGVPPRFAHAKLNDFPKAASDKVRPWLEQRNEGLLLTGPVGTGKTYLAAAITRVALDSIPLPATYSISRPPSQVLFRRCAELYSELRNTFNSEKSESERSVLAPYLTAPMLVLDDIGAGAISNVYSRGQQ
jgi:DNA replication protein DnaC